LCGKNKQEKVRAKKNLMRSIVELKIREWCFFLLPVAVCWGVESYLSDSVSTAFIS
jgi:hypothetical protein